MNNVIIHEVGLRDGLQVEKNVVPMEQKIKWVENLIDAGIKFIQLGSFVNPQKVPQMADTDTLFSHFTQPGQKPADVTLSGLVLNEKGLERGMTCGVDLFCMGVSASETHSQKNTGMSTAEATERITAMAVAGIKAGKRVQASVQSAFGCGFEGPIPEENVLKIIEKYLAAGVKNISLADTAGHAHPFQVEKLFTKIRQLDPSIDLACHFHNTYGLGLANCFAAMNAGVKYLESAFGGLGGCPFTKLPAGNVSTEDLVHSLQRSNLCPDINLDKLIALAKDVGQFFQRELPGFVMKSGSIVNFKKKE
ncbi:MAG: hydroxymethylglutaryl-CoA lyase [Acidobacteria bacterium]|jgi:hydroxymethylglutaryl-CoA lyase|nr:hydroxymethylglutaryl-CoA lyase [Acidobacteriota bacterium]